MFIYFNELPPRLTANNYVVLVIDNFRIYLLLTAAFHRGCIKMVIVVLELAGVQTAQAAGVFSKGNVRSPVLYCGQTWNFVLWKLQTTVKFGMQLWFCKSYYTPTDLFPTKDM